MHNDSLAEQLQKQLIELEGQLAEAQATIRALQAEQGQNGSLRQPPSGGNSLGISEESLRQALLVAPCPLMIWREDGTVLLVNTAFRQAAGYDVHEIPTIQHWYTKAFGAHPAPAFVIPDGDDQPDVKKWREYEVTTRTGEQRIWDFSNALLGVDQDGRHLIVTLALDITERRQIEEQMQENEQKFSIIFEKAPFAAPLSRLPEGTLTL